MSDAQVFEFRPPEPEPAPVITQPGIYEISEDAYHADPVPDGSLSSTGARRLLPPSCPAKYKYLREHPEIKGELDYGSAAHKLILGSGPEVVVVDADSWRTNKAKDQAVWAREKGKIPILAKDHAEILAMADALMAHPLAASLLDPAGGGHAEQSLFWYDKTWGIWKRARLDWLPDPDMPGRLIIPDYKTAKSANPAAFGRAAADFGYHQQAAFYSDGAREIGLADDVAFLFIVQEKTPPYLVSVVELDIEAIRLGRRLNERACEIWRDCTASGIWPGYSADPRRIEYVDLPRWAYYREDELS